MIHWIQQTDEIVVHLRDSRKIKPAVEAWSLTGRLRGNPRQLKIRNLIDQARSNTDGDPGADAETLRKLRVHSIPAVAIFAVFVLFAYLLHG